MSEYEIKRASNIVRNNKKLVTTGLKDLKDMIPPTKQSSSDSDGDYMSSSSSPSENDEKLSPRRSQRVHTQPKAKRQQKWKPDRSDEDTYDFDDGVNDPVDGTLDWTKDGVAVGVDELLGDTVLGEAGHKTGKLCVTDRRLYFLMDETTVEPENLKARAALLGLNVHKSTKGTDKDSGISYTRKIFFYIAGVKKPKNAINFIRFARRKSGLYTLSSTKTAQKLLEMWSELMPPQSDKVQEVIQRQPMRYTPEAVRTAISMLIGDSRTHSTYRQIADRLNDEHAQSAYKVNEGFRDYKPRDIRRLVDKMFPKVSWG